MTQPTNSAKRIAVIGGGISGLATAFRISELASQHEVRLFEASDRVGGVLKTVHRDGYLLERSADMFTTKDPWAVDLCERIGFTDQLIKPNDEFRRAFVVFRGQLHPVPEGFSLMAPTSMRALLKSKLLSWSGKMRMGWEYFVSATKSNEDESLHSFVTRRLGQQAFDRLVQPLISGIYTADPKKLSMRATLPQFLDMEQKYGGILRAIRSAPPKQEQREAGGARYGVFTAPRDGMQSFVDAVAAKLPERCIQLNAPVQSLRQLPKSATDGHGPDSNGPDSNKSDNRAWEIEVDGKPPEQFDAIVLATQSSRISALIEQRFPELAQLVNQVTHASAAVVTMGVKRSSLQHPLDGFGFVVPNIEQRPVLACSFTSVKFEGRAPDDHVLMRVFIGGALQADLLERDDDELQEMALQQTRELLGLSEPPVFCEVSRWMNTMPQYHVKIESEVDRIEGLELAGNSYRGVGVPFCIRSGEKAAQKVVDFLT
jgi:oxygen-dependent protoporphyrinogen oxidase